VGGAIPVDQLGALSPRRVRAVPYDAQPAGEAAGFGMAGGGGAGVAARSERGGAHAGAGLQRTDQAAERSFIAASGSLMSQLRGTRR
jgi:hypothetical protein